VHEGNLEAEHPEPRLAVDQLGATRREVRDRDADVGDLVGDVVHAGAALGEKPADGRIIGERGQELDPAVADANRRSFHALLVHAGPVLETPAEETLVGSNGLVEVRDGNADVVDSAWLHAGDATARPWRAVASATVAAFAMGRRIVIGLVTFASVALVAAGCGGGSSSSNSEAGKSAVTVFQDAQKAAIAGKSVHVSGALNDGGHALAIDLVLAQGKGKGTMSESGLSFEIIRIGNDAYIKGSDAFLSQFAGAGAAKLYHDKWLKGPLNTGALSSLAPLTDIAKLFAGAFGTHGKLVNKGDTTYHGQKAVAIEDKADGSVLYVAATGTPYPIGATEGGTAKTRSVVNFDHWNNSVSIAAPKGAIDMSKARG
jgi:hypothetical protein